MRTPWGTESRGVLDLVVVGVDPSLTGMGVCVIADREVVREELYGTESTTLRPERLIMQRDRLLAVLREAAALGACRRCWVAMEGEIWTANAAQGSEQAALQATLQVGLYEWFAAQTWPRQFVSVNVAHVKKYADAGKKNEVLLQVFKRWGREYRNDNQADAFLVATIAYDLLARQHHLHPMTRPKLSKPQLEVLEKLAAKGFVWAPRSPDEEKPKRARRQPRLQ